MFSGISRRNSRCIACQAQERILPRRHDLYRQGEPRRHLYVIASGWVKITRLDAAGNEVILAVRGPGDVVGGLGLKAGSPHRYSAQTIEPCHVFFWPTAMESLWERSNTLQRNLSTILAEHLDELSDRFSELATDKVELRLAQTLLRLQGKMERPAGEAVRINLSRQELAQMMGTTVFAVSRLLSEWTKLGIVDARREAVIVFDNVRLKELAGEETAA